MGVLNDEFIRIKGRHREAIRRAATVEVLAIVAKADAEKWLERFGEANEEGSSL